MRDFKRLQKDPPAGINASPQADNIMQWNAVRARRGPWHAH